MSPDFSQGRLHAGLAQSTSSVALAWHTAMSNTPIMGNFWEGDNRVDTASHGVQQLALIHNFRYTYVSHTAAHCCAAVALGWQAVGHMV